MGPFFLAPKFLRARVHQERKGVRFQMEGHDGTPNRRYHLLPA